MASFKPLGRAGIIGINLAMNLVNKCSPDDKKTHAWSLTTMIVAASTVHRLCDRKYTLNAASSIA
jgi:hypothetical protein